MLLPPLLMLSSEEDYRTYYVIHYCRAQVVTFDGVVVRFFPEIFDHAFYRDSSPTAKDKANFDLERAQRMDWIRAALEDPALELDRRVMPDSKVRRIALEPTVHYAVIIQIKPHSPLLARFITAYVVDSAGALRR